MKSVYTVSAAAICLGLLLVGCAGSGVIKTVVPWDLKDRTVRQDLDQLMGNAGISDRGRKLFFRQLEEKDGEDYDSRIMAYSLLEGNFLEVEVTGFESPKAERQVRAGTQLIRDPEAFQIFYAPLPVAPEERKDPAELWLDSWEKRGVKIHESPRARLISVLSEEQSEEGPFLTIQQAGILFPETDNGMQFLYCPSPGKQPVLVSVPDRKQLRDYLGLEVRGEETPPGKFPILLENSVSMDIS